MLPLYFLHTFLIFNMKLAVDGGGGEGGGEMSLYQRYVSAANNDESSATPALRSSNICSPAQCAGSTVMNIENIISFVNISPAMALLDCYGSLVPRPHLPASGMRRVHARGPNIYCIPGIERVERVLSMHNWA